MAAASVVALKNPGSARTDAKLGSSNGFSITGLEPGNYKVGFAAMPAESQPQ